MHDTLLTATTAAQVIVEPEHTGYGSSVLGAQGHDNKVEPVS